MKGFPSLHGDVNIGNDVRIGLGATILSGVTAGDGAVQGARSVVAMATDNARQAVPLLRSIRIDDLVTF